MFRELFAAALTETWAIRETVLHGMLESARTGEPPRRTKLPKVSGRVAILPMQGVISQRASIWQEFFGGTSTMGFGAAFSRAINDDRVGGIVLDVDSPGGTTAGVEELADTIWQGGQQKPVAAVSNSQMASAAYWLSSQVGSQQGRLVAAPGSDTGSIGVFRMHEDISEMMAADGIKVSFLAMPEFKTEGNPFEPLSEAAREHHMEQVAATYETFVAAVARGRGVSRGTVARDFGRGRTFHAEQAAELGLVDRVATMGRVLDELGVDKSASISQAESQQIEEELCHAWETGEPELLVEMVPIISRKVAYPL